MRCVRLPMERRNGTFNTTNTYHRLLINPVASVFIFDFCKSEEEEKTLYNLCFIIILFRVRILHGRVSLALNETFSYISYVSSRQRF